MVYALARARVTDVIYAQLAGGDDIYEAILDICRREKIRTGLVLNIVGGLKKARLSMPVGMTPVNMPPGFREWDGEMMECSGHGIIGHTMETFDSSGTSEIVNRAGDPYIHVHMTITAGGSTYMGHLIEGCIVRSLHAQSHFTIALAKTEGATLNLRVSKEEVKNFPYGVPLHELIQD